MTREEIVAKWAELCARERDVWIAEVVFGLNVEYENGEPYVSDFGFGRVMDEYTTDISAAWAVLEAFEYHTVGTHVDGSYRAQVGRWDGKPGSRIVDAYAETEPEAVCLAAIIAKLTEVTSS
ncbi:hypothetical protein [Paenibacillus odorifer]|uniref:BC1872 family protein n=1 Tax=Paenibacillus TaxID=44249 RepID=UPI00096DAE25|nr:hypothetical protein [Paenibacillus odorifer]OMD02554.1 hypothetical protein BJP46_15745 [Paenibacillus odorifer]